MLTFLTSMSTTYIVAFLGGKTQPKRRDPTNRSTELALLEFLLLGNENY